MKSSLSFTFVAALVLGVALIVGYALLGNPAPSQPATLLSPASVPAQPEGELARGPMSPLSSSDSGAQASHVTQSCVTRVQPATQGVQSQPASTRLAGELSAAFPPGAATAEYQPASTGTSTAAELPLRVPIPLAFRPLPPAMAAANPQLADTLTGLQQNFVGAVAGSNQDPSQSQGQDPSQGSSPAPSQGSSQDPNDPAYYARWVAAQQNSDDQYRLLVGSHVFLTEQMKVNNQ